MSNQTQSNALPPSSNTPSTAEAFRKHMGARYAQRPRVSKYTKPQRPFDIGDPEKVDPFKWEASVAVHDAQSPLLVLVLHSVPIDHSLVTYVESLGGQIIPKSEHASFVIHLAPTDTPTIRVLARMIRSVVTENWRWLSEKFATALVQLANHLDQFKPPPAPPPATTPPPTPGFGATNTPATPPGPTAPGNRIG
jgi:hypothetical protein